MPINGYTVGRDVTLRIVTGAGNLRIKGITRFQSKQDTQEQKIKKIDGVTDHVRFFDGWSGRFAVERQDSTIDDYFSQLEADYYQGINEQPASITQTIVEVNGATTQYRYVKALLKLDDAGEYAGDSSVKIALAFIASRRIKIA